MRGIRTITSWSLLIIMLSLGSGASSGWQWRKLEFPASEPVYYISGKNVDDFWVKTATGTVLHYQAGKVESIAPPTQSDILEYTYIIDPREKLWLLLGDMDYHSTVWTYERGVWQQEKLNSTVPLKALLFPGNGAPWCYGDWGSLYRRNGRQWIVVDSPIENHIFCATESSDGMIYFGTRAQGIFRYDGTVFTSIPIKDYQNEDIRFILLSDDNQDGIALSGNGRIFRYNGKEFVPEDDIEVEKITVFPRFTSMNLGLIIATASDPIALVNRKPILVLPPIQDRITGGQLFNLQSGILTGNSGTVLIARRERRQFFVDLASRSYVDGSTFDQSIGAGWVTLDADAYPDLFVMNKGVQRINRLYHNNRNLQFGDYTWESNLANNGSFQYFNSGDLTGDGLDDLVILRAWSDSLRVTTKYQIWNQWQERVQEFQLDSLRSLHGSILVDMDQDGDLDCVLLFAYRQPKNRGNVLVLENHLGGRFTVNRSQSGLNSAGWNQHILAADLNNDHAIDFYVCNKWDQDQLLINRGGKFVNEFTSRVDSMGVTNSWGAAAVDVDNDGDLDLFVRSTEHNLSLLENDGHGYFRPVMTGADSIPVFSAFPTFSHVNFADINHDGYVDIFGADLDYPHRENILLLNGKDHTYINRAAEMDVEKLVVEGSIIADVDHDGDLDIYGYRNDVNSLWINNLNDSNFVVIIPRASGFNSTALGAKVWLYRSENEVGRDSLIGFRQIGTNNLAMNQVNSPVVHFGVPSDWQCAVRVRFPSGIEVWQRDIHPGRYWTVYEHGLWMRILWRAWTEFIAILFSPDMLRYVVTTVFVFLMVGMTAGIGWRRYRWKLNHVLPVVILNLSAYWILIMLTRGESIYARYLLPVFPVILGTMIPLIWSDRFRVIKSLLQQNNQAENDLLSSLLVFSHGEWAMRNINGLILLGDNMARLDNPPKELIRQLQDRISTFLQTTLPALDKIVNLARTIYEDPDRFNELHQRLELLRSSLNSLPEGEAPKKSTISTLVALKDDLRLLKQSVYRQYSCNVQSVILRLTDSLEPLFREKGILVIRTLETDVQPIGLIPEKDLAPVLDNVIQNAIRALSGTKSRELTLKIYRYSPKLRIDICDTGAGIPESDRDRIFETGFSGYGGTGQGLPQAREILAKYGGRIYLKSSQIGVETIFTIELLEGTV
ncbi:MAG: GHKL domain-containing protein [FCB group bacterium]|nr:GHKL domain-containing protein [FCB group bacterium]